MILLGTILVVWITVGLMALTWGVRIIHAPGNKGKLDKHLKDLADEFGIEEENCLCVLYVSFVALGFVGVLVAAYRKISSYFKRGK